MDLMGELGQYTQFLRPAAELVWHYLLPFLFVLAILVVVHELGHYLTARLFDVHIESITIGFGRELWARTDRRGTRCAINILPLCGFVHIDQAKAGDDF